ncbi:hypothetical protein DUNSADRAFT_10386 [Dunaliella salina]|uniref:BZIP domain-containing protein n=1 Tax=Dunaliella salina TaxID=3046 RepID=A0ABQ7GFH0_DUNSA|nr:hypothetical protein DUNSADRAFT_10386 [Dunaliella salina]|eukprot:KAF5833345.1 hypothetical protein DUNSADRAFT_10386 [Dunaliella salina]
MLPRLNGTLPGIFPQSMPISDANLAAQMLAAPDDYGLHEKTKGQALGPAATAAAEAFGMGDFDDLDNADDEENMSFDQHVENLQGILDAACIPPLPVPLRTLMEACCAGAKSSRGVVQPTARDLTSHIPPDQRASAMARIRREKNRQAARKCRSKRIRCTNETEQRLNELHHANRLLQQELFGWQARFAREGQKRELLKLTIHQHWIKDGRQTDVLRQALPAGIHTAADLICAIEAGNLDVQDLLARLQGLHPQPDLSMPTHASSPPLSHMSSRAKSADFLLQPAALQGGAKLLQGAPPQDRGLAAYVGPTRPTAQDDSPHQHASRGVPTSPLKPCTPSAAEAAAPAPSEQPAAQPSTLAAAGGPEAMPPPFLGAQQAASPRPAQVVLQPPSKATLAQTPSPEVAAAGPPGPAWQILPDQPEPASKDPPSFKDPPASQGPPASGHAAPLDVPEHSLPIAKSHAPGAPCHTLSAQGPPTSHQATVPHGIASPPTRTGQTTAVPSIPPHLRNTAPGGPASLNPGVRAQKPRTDHRGQYTPAPARARPPPPPPPMVSMPPLSGFSSGASPPQPAQPRSCLTPLQLKPSPALLSSNCALQQGCSSNPPYAHDRNAPQQQQQQQPQQQQPQQQQQQPQQQDVSAAPWPCAQGMLSLPEGGTPLAFALKELLELAAKLPGICKEETPGTTLKLQQGPCRPVHQKRAAAHTSCELAPTKRMKLEDD